MRREELLRQEAAEKEKMALAREQMLKQEKKELLEQNAKREEKFLENEYKRQKLQTEMQLEIERQRAASEANNVLAQIEMFERREAELAAKKEKQAQAEKEYLQKFYEQRIALDKKYYDEKERRMKHEAQLREQNLRFAKKEQLVPVPN